MIWWKSAKNHNKSDMAWKMRCFLLGALFMPRAHFPDEIRHTECLLSFSLPGSSALSSGRMVVGRFPFQKGAAPHFSPRNKKKGARFAPPSLIF